MGVRVASAVLAISTISLASALSSASAQERLPEIQVISNTPMQGSGIDKDKIPSMTSSVTADDFQRSYSQNVTDTLFQRVPGVTLSDPNGNNVQQEIRYRGSTAFNANSTLGYIYPDLSVGYNPSIPGNGSIIHTVGNLGYTPVGIDTRNTYYGLYLSDTFDITDKLSATAGARYNIAQIRVRDVLGTSPDLNSDSTFTRLNPVAGLTTRSRRG